MQEPGSGPPTARQRWAALAGQQQAAIVLAIAAIILLVVILLVLLIGGNNDDADDDAALEATPTAEQVEPTATPEPEPTATPEPEPTETPEPEPTATPEPEPTETPEPEPTETPEPEPTETPEPEPTATPEPEPTATPEPEPTDTPEPEPTTPPVLEDTEVEDEEDDVYSPEGEEPPAALPVVDLREVYIAIDDDEDQDLRVRFTSGDDIPDAADPGVVLTWTIVAWVDDEETYRVTAVLEEDEWTVTVIDVIADEETVLDDDPDVDGAELEIELSRELFPQITGPFTWAAMAMIQTADGEIFGDNVPDAGDTFVENPEPDQRNPFP